MSSIFQRIQKQQFFQNKNGWLSIRTVDMHTGGEPLRVILSGLPTLEGKSVLQYRRYMKENLDKYRKLLMLEPRGHADMYGCVLLPPNNDSSDFGILFLHNEGYSTMCGHAIIAITKLAAEQSWINIEEPVTRMKIDAPCGTIESFARIQNKKIRSTYFHGVPSFVVGVNIPLNTASIGAITYDLAYGGAFYAYVDADKFEIDLSQENYTGLIHLGMEIKKEVIRTNQHIKHPFEADLSFLYGTIFISNKSLTADSKNVCIFANGEVDRSPTGSGVSGRMALHYKKGDLQIGEEMKIESITGSIFTASVVELVKFGEFDAVIPRVEGTAFITGQHEFLLDPEDPFQEGFFLR